ncbi:sugar ABC transporter permease [Lederbergia sp. NSJ-179]|uniref:carbohydrate ABC transporter permease n=1 Tax=Lederbergia sp. NSJ-179 TaxID=2931402 RepID=UPI001FD236F3|nr:sugar ABC transporter permease [Lederbergia sp. NSJ-179]MCJ7842254.1 sugar ABC transporter permease [Lederbergia sp. NSJ-179]
MNNQTVELQKNGTKKIKKIPGKRTEEKWFYLFISPWIIGFLCFILGPIVASFFLSFTDWDLFTPAKWVGLDNYKNLVQDKIFWKTVYNTFYFALISVPLTMILSLGMAYLLAHKMRGMSFFRTIFYLPALVPIVASSMIFKFILAPDNGVINHFLAFFGIEGPAWLLDPTWVKMSFVFLAIWGVGANMVLLLAAIQGVPEELYESADMDGASKFKKFIHITIPIISPVIFFNLIMGIIGSLQAFSQIYILTGGGPNNASNMMVPYLFSNAFEFYKMGYASSIAWVLFIIIIIFTVIVFKSSSMWVYYESEVKK